LNKPLFFNALWATGESLPVAAGDSLVPSSHIRSLARRLPARILSISLADDPPGQQLPAHDFAWTRVKVL